MHRGEHLLSHLRRDASCLCTGVPTPFGLKPLVYADFTASGRAVEAVERVIRERVLPFYANTHSEASFTGMQTGRFRDGARQAVRRAVGASERHAVIFAGNGATGAIAKFVGAFAEHDPADMAVFVGPYEHHSNDLPWRELGAHLVRIPLDASGRLCLRTLEEALVRHADKSVRIGAFSAASNVTGLRTDMRALARLLHAHGAICLADYAAAAPYVEMSMAESAPGAGDHCDAIVFSPHKFVGGPGASGVLVVRRDLFSRARPVVPGGGTVSYVTGERHRYVLDIERREEGGTPNILGDIRAGLACELKAAIGVEVIAEHEERARAKAQAVWGREPSIEVLGPNDEDCLAIFPLVIRHDDKVLHPGLVVAALNDLFGIQARAGCSCAGPYAHALLDIDEALAQRYEALVAEGFSFFRPGWTRLGFNILHDQETVDYIIEAVAFIARNGAGLLDLYRPDPQTGRWRARSGNPPVPATFEELSVAVTGGQAAAPHAPQLHVQSFAECLEQAHRVLEDRSSAGEHGTPFPAELEDCRWFAA